MSYVKNNLKKNENIYFEGNISKLYLLSPFVWCILPLIIDPKTDAGKTFAGGIMCLSLIIFVYRLFCYYTTEYIITTERLMIKRGFIVRDTFDVSLKK